MSTPLDGHTIARETERESVSDQAVKKLCVSLPALPLCKHTVCHRPRLNEKGISTSTGPCNCTTCQAMPEITKRGMQHMVGQDATTRTSSARWNTAP